MEDYIWSRDYIDAMDDFGHIISTPQQLVDGMDRLKPRLYSIASSPEHEPGTVHLTVGVVRYSHHDRDRTGLATGFLADRCDVGESNIGIFMSPTRSFVLPEDKSTDVIMVGPGTGIAPSEPIFSKETSMVQLEGIGCSLAIGLRRENTTTRTKWRTGKIEEF